MHAYPGRTFGQLYHRFFRINDLADGPLDARRRRELDLADVRVPVLAVAGRGDGSRRSRPSTTSASLLPNAPAVGSRPRRAAISAC